MMKFDGYTVWLGKLFSSPSPLAPRPSTPPTASLRINFAFGKGWGLPRVAITNHQSEIDFSLRWNDGIFLSERDNLKKELCDSSHAPLGGGGVQTYSSFSPSGSAKKTA